MQNNYKIKVYLFKLLLLLIIFQQFPIVFESFYKEFRITIYIVFSLLTLLSLPSLKKALQYKFVFIYFNVLIYSILLSILSWNNIVLNLGIPFFAIIISLGIKLDDGELKRLLRLFVIGVTIMGVAVVFYYAEGFSIISTYAIPAKNGRGPIIGYTILISFINIFKEKDQNEFFLNKYLSVMIFSLNFLILLTFRNRASILGVTICVLFILFSKFKFKKSLLKWFIIFFVVSIFIILSVLGLLNGLYNYIWNSVTLNFDVTDINSLSAGRTDVYRESLHYSLKYPIAGEIVSESNVIGIPHNYLLYNWMTFGVGLSFPLMLLYLNLWSGSLKNILKNKEKSLPVWLLLFSLIVSIFEYSYPYGPGVSQLFMWFLIGQYIQRN